ncbi:MAG: glycoside hydrolase family 3 protein, partial [Lachnospiraceae bacterium]|nr:glycoside hydrolase family 3 protein [Lachnospiraceae bacterium]
MIPIYKDPTKSIEERVQDLLPRMTLDEKIREMHLFTRPTTRFPDHKPGTKFTAEEVEPMLEHGCSMYTTDSAPAELINGLQDYMLHETRLGIPFTVHGEALHGAMNENATVFPNPIAMAATFDEGLILETATAVGEEERANGVRQVYAPNLDLSQEPRWGRCEENFGEDPYLTSRMGVSYVKGLQANGVAASPKHYAAHGNPQGGLNMATIHCGERELRETYLYPFKKAFTEGGAWSVMPAYHEMDGVPCHSNYHLLTEILRDEFGLKGPVISDWNGITRIHALHRVAETPEEAGEMALRAGVDVEAPGIFGYGEGFKELVKAGKIPMELVDRAVGRVLWLKFKLGLFEDPYALPEEEKKKHCRTKEHLDLSRHVEEEGAVLLKNE